MNIVLHIFISSSAGVQEVGCKSHCSHIYHSRLCYDCLLSSLLMRIAAICIILLYIGLQLQRHLFSDQLFYKKVVLKTGNAIYYFRVKNG